jgi:hypothetical protein
MHEPFGVDDLGERFCEKVCGIVDTGNVVDVDAAFVDTVAYVMRPDVDMFHLQVRMRIMSTRNGTFIVAE